MIVVPQKTAQYPKKLHSYWTILQPTNAGSSVPFLNCTALEHKGIEVGEVNGCGPSDFQARPPIAVANIEVISSVLSGIMTWKEFTVYNWKLHMLCILQTHSSISKLNIFKFDYFYE